MVLGVVVMSVSLVAVSLDRLKNKVQHEREGYIRYVYTYIITINVCMIMCVYMCVFPKDDPYVYRNTWKENHSCSSFMNICSSNLTPSGSPTAPI